MKKMILMLAVVLPMLASAQKIGHVNSQEIMALMPETKRMGEKLDSLQSMYETQLANMQEEFNKKVAEFQQQQTTMTAGVRSARTSRDGTTYANVLSNDSTRFAS